LGFTATARLSVLKGGLVAIAIVSAACGGGGPSTTGSATTGTPVKVMVTSPFSGANAVTLYPEIIPAVKARVAAVNAAGGINGHPIQLQTCDDQGDANLAANCARQAVSDGVVAVIGGFSLNLAQELPILEQAGISIFGQASISPTDAQSKVAFPFSSGDVTWPAIARALAKAGCKRLGLAALSGNATSKRFATNANDAFVATGGVVVDTVLLPPTSADYSPVVASLISKGSECMAPVLGAGEAAKFVTAVKQSGKNIKLAGTTNTMKAIVQALGSQADGILVVNQFYLTSDDVPAVKAAIAEIKKYAGNDVALNTGTSVWGTSKILFEAMKTIKRDITAASVLDALNKVSGGVSDFYAPIDFSKPGPDPMQPRAVNWKYVTWTVTNGAFKLSSPEFLSAK